MIDPTPLHVLAVVGPIIVFFAVVVVLLVRREERNRWIRSHVVDLSGAFAQMNRALTTFDFPRAAESVRQLGASMASMSFAAANAAKAFKWGITMSQIMAKQRKAPPPPGWHDSAWRYYHEIGPLDSP